MNHQNFERTLRFRDIPGSMLVGVSAHHPSPTKGLGPRLLTRDEGLFPDVRWNLRVDLRTRRRRGGGEEGAQNSELSPAPILTRKASRPPKSRPAKFQRSLESDATKTFVRVW